MGRYQKNIIERRNWLNLALLFVIVLAGVVGLITAFPIPGHPLNEIGCGSSYATGCDASNSNGIIDNAELATTATTAVNAQTLDNLDSTAFCRSNGNNCPARDGTLSCREVAGAQSVGTSTATCADDYEVTGGGCHVIEQHGFKKAKKSGNGWICVAGNSAWTVTAYAVCCKII